MRCGSLTLGVPPSVRHPGGVGSSAGGAGDGTSSAGPLSGKLSIRWSSESSSSSCCRVRSFGLGGVDMAGPSAAHRFPTGHDSAARWYDNPPGVKRASSPGPGRHLFLGLAAIRLSLKVNSLFSGLTTAFRSDSDGSSYDRSTTGSPTNGRSGSRTGWVRVTMYSPGRRRRCPSRCPAGTCRPSGPSRGADLQRLRREGHVEPVQLADRLLGVRVDQLAVDGVPTVPPAPGQCEEADTDGDGPQPSPAEAATDVHGRPCR